MQNSQPLRMQEFSVNRDLRMRALLAKVRRSADDLDLEALLQTLYAYAVLSRTRLGEDGEFIARLQDRVVEELQLPGARYQRRWVADILWGFVRLGLRPRADLVELVELELKQKVFTFSATGIANTVWAYGQLGYHPGGDVLSRLALEGRDRLGSLSGGQISQMLWAFGKLGFYPGKQLTHAFLEEFCAKLDRARPAEVASALWGCAKVKHAAKDEALAQCARALGREGGRYSPKAVSTALWAFAQFEHYPGAACMDRLLGYAEEHVRAFNPVSLGLTFYALAKLQHRPGARLLRAAQALLEEEPEGFNSLTATFLLYAAAKLNLEPGGALVDLLCGRVRDLLHEAEPWDLVFTVWSLAVLRTPTAAARELVEAAWRTLADREDLQLGPLHTQTLYHAYVALNMETDLEVHLSEALVAAGKIEWQRLNVRDDVTGSQLQREVADRLVEMGVSHRYEQAIAGQLFRTDICLLDRPVAVEVDGPSHYLRNERSENGPTRLRNRLLAEKGYDVLTVPYFEWEGLSGREAKHAYLRGKLDAVDYPALDPPRPLDLSPDFLERLAELDRAPGGGEGGGGGGGVEAPPSPPARGGGGEPQEAKAFASAPSSEEREAKSLAEIAEQLREEDPEDDGRILGSESFADFFGADDAAGDAGR